MEYLPHQWCICDDIYVLVPLGKDFTDDSSVVTIPASPDVNGEFEIPANFTTIIDDEIDEFEQSFILVAEIGSEVPDSFVCFQRQAVGTGCMGREQVQQKLELGIMMVSIWTSSIYFILVCYVSLYNFRPLILK